MEPYQELYSEFMKTYGSGSITGEEVGGLVAKLAGYYPTYNLALAMAERNYAKVAKEEIIKTDEATGKAISAAKAEILSSASDECFDYKKAKAHIANLEMLIQSAKSLQRGLLQEMMHSNLG